jgi:hypothetical protein
MSGAGYWPTVASDKWCGKFQIEHKLAKMHDLLSAPETSDDDKAKLKAAIAKRLVSR